jgi:hypothetical protein
MGIPRNPERRSGLTSDHFLSMQEPFRAIAEKGHLDIFGPDACVSKGFSDRFIS